MCLGEVTDSDSSFPSRFRKPVLTRRRDLKLIVTSATMNADKVSMKHFLCFLCNVVLYLTIRLCFSLLAVPTILRRSSQLHNSRSYFPRRRSLFQDSLRGLRRKCSQTSSFDSSLSRSRRYSCFHDRSRRYRSHLFRCCR